VACNEDLAAAEDPAAAIRLVGNWSHRKKRMFGRDHVTTAWQRLRGEGWLISLVLA
jgi:hypothetical protein